MIEKIIKQSIHKALALTGYQLTKINTSSKESTSQFLDISPSPSAISPFVQWLRQLKIETILDVGANQGQSVFEFREMLPDATIYSFEPLEECFAQLQENTKHLKNVYSFNIALGNINQEQTFYESEYSPSSSLLNMGDLHKTLYPHTAKNTPRHIVVKQLDFIVSELKLQPNILLKMDVQGFENRVLEGSQNTLKDVSIIISEVLFQELYEDQAYFSDIYDILSQNDFDFQGIFQEGRKNPKNGLPLYSDLIFVRKDLLN